MLSTTGVILIVLVLLLITGLSTLGVWLAERFSACALFDRERRKKAELFQEQLRESLRQD